MTPLVFARDRLRRAQGGRWLAKYLADHRALRAIDGGRLPGFELAIDAAVLLVILVDVLAIAALVSAGVTQP